MNYFIFFFWRKGVVLGPPDKLNIGLIAKKMILIALIGVSIAVYFTDVTEAANGLRSVKLNSYNNWLYSASDPADEGRKLQLAARYDKLAMLLEYGWETVTPAMVHAINPACEAYLNVPDLCQKGAWERDWADSEGPLRIQNIMPRTEIESNGWWLVDTTSGEPLSWFDEGELEEVMVDVGKPGYKEALLGRFLRQMDGKGYAGAILGYSCPCPSWVVPIKNTRYGTDRNWQEQAWWPLLEYLTNGLHAAGYKIIGVSSGEWNTGIDYYERQRSYCDGVIVENFAVHWDGSYYTDLNVISNRIAGLTQDPLEVWVADIGIRPERPNYAQKAQLALAMYYIGVGASGATRSFHYRGDGKLFWDPLWDFYIGSPAEPPVKRTGNYFWSRKFTEGIVLLNYESSEATFPLDRPYINSQGDIKTSSIIIPGHSAEILKIKDVDTAPPARITDLNVSNITQTSVKLSWTAPGDDGNQGRASQYDIRYSSSNISEANWQGANQVYEEPAPLSNGTSQSFTLAGLSSSTTYYFVIKTSDEAFNWSGLSNVVSAKTLEVTIVKTLNVFLSANPSSGIAPLKNVDLTANISGTAEGTANYTFYCNRADTGAYITSGYAKKIDTISANSYMALDVCDYLSPGQYKAKVIVEKDYLIAEARVDISVTSGEMTIEELQAKIAELLAQINVLKAQLAQLQPLLEIPSNYRFTKPLYLNQRNTDVRYLQLFLKSQGAEIYPEAKVTGYFGRLTWEAVIKFQIKYGVLASRYSRGAGLVGPKTRAKINEILGR